MKHDRIIIALLLTTLMTVLLPLTAAQADRDHHDWRKHDRGDQRDRREYRDREDHRDRREYRDHDRYFDSRFKHDRYYPRRGITVHRVPDNSLHVTFGDNDYLFSGGVWYHPFGGFYRVVAPPIGIVVHTLPSFYTTVWIGGIPYYYANDVYYVWNPDDNGYVVTAKPADADAKAATTTTTPKELYIYPMKGQSKQKQADDRYACHEWSVSQTHYDPSQPPANLSPAEMSNELAAYNRAMKACLTGRGYSVD